jgi:S-adenosyl-L-methionine hydrolase (adenosine-forming)
MAVSPIITLLTDFGWGDGHIGAMKGVILGINPDCRIIDLAHQVTPHDVMGAALVLGKTYAFFPTGTIHLVVVDPGVGGVRKPLVLQTRDYLFVGPDNGCFTPVLKQEQEVRAYELAEQRFRLARVSQTFHGRDIFAPAAAHLSLRIAPKEMGPAVDGAALTRLAIPEPKLDGAGLRGEVIWIDSFGNLVTNISQEDLREFAPDSGIEIGIRGERIKGLKRSYEEGKEGEIICLWGSAGLLEIALKERNLNRELGWGRGEKIWIRRKR